MIDMKSRAGDEMEKAMGRAVLESNAAYVVIGLAVSFFVAKFVPWMAGGFKVVGL